MPDIDIQLDTNLYTGSENAIDEMSPVKATTEESEKTLTEKVRRIFVKGNVDGC